MQNGIAASSAYSLAERRSPRLGAKKISKNMKTAKQWEEENALLDARIEKSIAAHKVSLARGHAEIAAAAAALPGMRRAVAVAAVMLIVWPIAAAIMVLGGAK